MTDDINEQDSIPRAEECPEGAGEVEVVQWLYPMNHRRAEREISRNPLFRPEDRASNVHGLVGASKRCF